LLEEKSPGDEAVDQQRQHKPDEQPRPTPQGRDDGHPFSSTWSQEKSLDPTGLPEYDTDQDGHGLFGCDPRHFRCGRMDLKQ
jgi:hypothetical protein